MKLSIEIVTLAISFGGIIWKISQLQAEVYKCIDEQTDLARDEIKLVEKDLYTHLASCAEKEENLEYRINSEIQAVKHKAERLEGIIKEIASALKNKGIY